MLSKKQRFRIRELKQEISNLELQKQQAGENIQSIYKEYLLNRISFAEYNKKIKEFFNNRTEKEHFAEIDSKIKNLNQRIKSIEQQSKITATAMLIIPIILVLALSLNVFKPRITGLTVYNESFENIENKTISALEQNASIQEVFINESSEQNLSENLSEIVLSENITKNISQNLTAELIENISENLTIINMENITETLPANLTENISSEINETTAENITGNISYENVSLENVSFEQELSENISSMIEKISANLTANLTENISKNITKNISEFVENITNNAPELIKKIENIVLKQGQTITINLSEYFYDKDNDTLIFTLIKPEGVGAEIVGEIVSLRADEVALGKKSIVFLASDLKNITQSNEVIVTIIPEFENRIPNCFVIEVELLESEQKTINLSDYCFDYDNDTLNYEVKEISGLKTILDNSLLTITAEKQGNYELKLVVNDAKNTTTYLIIVNVSKAKISEELIQLPAEINKPVTWVKKIKVQGNNITLTTEIPEQAFNITLEKEIIIKDDVNSKEKKIKEKIKEEEVIVNIKGIVRTLKDEKRIKGEITTEEIINEQEQTKTQSTTQATKQSGITGMAVLRIERINFKELISKIILSIRNFFATIINAVRSIFRITGFIVYSEQENITLSFNAEPSDYIIVYQTKAPEITKEKVFVDEARWAKRLSVSSELHYTNITAYTKIFETESSRIHIYELTDESKIEITNNENYSVEFIDSDSNKLIDTLRWIIPHLSNKSYEVEVDLIILNVQSYPMIMGNWTVAFNTTGNADLKITATNETTYSELSIDYNETIDDLTFLEIKCDDELMNELAYVISEEEILECNNNTLIYNSTQTNISCFLDNETTLINYTQTMQQEISIITKSILIKNYSCDNKTSYFKVRVLTPGVHTQEFNFGGIIRYAHNLAGAPVITLESPINNTILHTGTILNFTITDDNLNQTWYSKDNGLTNTSLEEPWDINTSSWSEGTYNITIWASDNDTNIKKEDYYFIFNNSARGTLSVKLIWPSDFANTSVYKYETFNFKAEVVCTGGPCGDVNATLDPTAIRRMIEQELIKEKLKKQQKNKSNKGVENE
ncbi:MAG: hypothetical protein ACPLWC_00015 [Candidatus Woesearchaeota archaeon]